MKRILELKTKTIKKDILLRNLLTSLIINNQIVTTPKRAKVLKSYADKFFKKLIKNREKQYVLKTILESTLTNKEAIEKTKTLLSEINKTTWFVSNYRVWIRKWDNSIKVLVKINI